MSQTVNNSKANNIINIPTVPLPGGDLLKLQDLTASYVLTNASQILTDSTKNFHDNTSVTKVLEGKWDEMQCDASPTLKATMQNIEACVFLEIENTGLEDKEILLKERVNELFLKLAEKLEAKTFCECVIPVDLSSYEYLQKRCDEALLSLWKQGIFPKLGPDAPNLDAPSKIRAWLADPNNANQLSRITSLYLRGRGLEVFPFEIISLSSLEVLSLMDNQITTLPESLGNLTSLKALNLGENRIATLPESLGNLTSLRWLYLSNNRIVTLPESLGNLTSLQVLELQNNRIVTLPESLGNLTSLEKLNLGNNRIMILPESLGNLKALIYIYQNMFFFISDLKYLRCSNALPFTQRLLDFKNYKCNSVFSQFFQLVPFNIENPELIRSQFELLKPNDQALILEILCLECGFESIDIRAQELTLDNMILFCKAIRNSVSIKIDRLSWADKWKVYGEICKLAGKDDAEWGKTHAFKNILRLIDAMDQAGF